MIYLQPVGGLCNRLRAIASVIKLGGGYKDSIVVLWEINSDVGAGYEDLFSVSWLRWYASIKGIHLTIYHYKSDEQDFVQEIKAATGESNCYSKDYADNIAFLDAYTASRGENNFFLTSGCHFFKCKRWYDFWWIMPNKNIRHEIRTIARKQGKACIGIHIRRTDNKKAIENSPIELFIGTMEKEIIKNPEVKFFLATDDMYIKEFIIKRFEEKIITNNTSTIRRDTKDGMMAAVTDLFALACTRKIYGSYWSSFTDMAAILGHTRLEIVKRH